MFANARLATVVFGKLCTFAIQKAGSGKIVLQVRNATETEDTVPTARGGSEGDTLRAYVATLLQCSRSR